MRKINEARLQADRIAAAWKGLHGCSRYDLCDALETARSALGLTSDELFLLRYLIKRTRDQDWLPQARPLVAWARFYVMFDTGWTEDKLNRVEKSLCGKGFITFRDAPNCRRYAARDDQQRLTENTFGISLEPVGARAQEILSKAHQHAEDRDRLYRTFREAFDLRAELAEVAASEGVPTEISERVSEAHGSLPRRRDHAMSLSALRGLLDAARSVLDAARAFLGLPAAPAPAEPKIEPPTPAPKPATTIQGRLRKIAGQESPQGNLQRENQDLVRVLAAAPPMFQAYLAGENGRGDWQAALSKAMDRYGAALNLRPTVIGKMLKEEGLVKTLKTIFSVGRQIEAGRDIQNPCAYALKIIKHGHSPEKMYQWNAH